MRSIESIVFRVRVVPVALAASALVSLAACATTSAPSAARPSLDLATLQPSTSRLSYIITGASLPPERLLSDVVAERWPQLVRGELPRGDAGQASSIDRFGVFDTRGAFLGGPDYLQGIRAADVREIRRLTAVEESAQLGHRHPAGAVVIAWRRTL